MGKTISKGIFDEIVDRAICHRPAVVYDIRDGEPSSRIFQNARGAFEFVYNTLEIVKHATLYCVYSYLDGSGNQRTEETVIRFDFVEFRRPKRYTFLVDGVEISSYALKGRDEFADELVYRVFVAIAKEIHSKKEETK